MSISAFLSTKTFEPHEMFSDQEMVLNQHCGGTIDCDVRCGSIASSSRRGSGTWREFWRREWLAGSFSVADILMADVLRLVAQFDGLAGYPVVVIMSHARQPARPS
jgi:hypothetical protein